MDISTVRPDLIREILDRKHVNYTRGWINIIDTIINTKFNYLPWEGEQHTKQTNTRCLNQDTCKSYKTLLVVITARAMTRRQVQQGD